MSQRPASTENAEPVTRLASIDALRGIAFLSVLLVHVSQAVASLGCGAAPYFGQSLVSAGAFGVTLFFIASAYTLFSSHRARTGKDQSPVVSFFLRRVFRIVPMFWAGIVFYFLIYGTWNRNWAEGNLGWAHFGLTAFLLHGWHPDTINSVVPGGWSVAAEFTFYAAAPFLFPVIKTLRRAVFFYVGSVFLVVLLNCVARNGMIASVFPTVPAWRQASFTYLWFPSHLPSFLLGLVVFHLKDRSDQADTSSAKWIMTTALCAMLGLALWFRNDATDYLFPVALAAFSFALLRRGSAIFINRFTCMVGKISFSAYITHFAAIKVVEKALAGRHLASPQLAFCAIYAGALFVTLAAASVTYFAVERPGMELGRRLIKFFNKPGDGLHLPANTLKT